jgi:hypothetical protein
MYHPAPIDQDPTLFEPLPARTISAIIACSFDEAYGFAQHPENFPRWASGLATSLRQEGPDWIARTPHGEARVLFSPPNPYGILDHWITPLGDAEIYVPLRLIANGRGTLVVLTLFRQPGMDDAAFERDARLVDKDLRALKALLEDAKA